MLFLGTDENGENEGGMVSRIVKSAPYEYMSIEHIGLIGDGKEELWNEDEYSYENYTFNEKDGVTELLVEITNVPDDWNEMEEVWPEALEKLKEIIEK